MRPYTEKRPTKEVREIRKRGVNGAVRGLFVLLLRRQERASLPQAGAGY